MTPRVSIVMPAYNEGERIVPAVDRVLEAVATPCELLVVYDSPDDTTAPHLATHPENGSRLVPTLNTDGRGAARAIRFGIRAARAGVVVVTMADGSDEAAAIDRLVALVEQGAVVAAASRYSPGGEQIGGPKLKGFLSRLAGLSLHWFAGVPTRDATNSFKAYSKPFVDAVGIESDAGFEIALELVAKARRRRLPIAEVPTIWRDRADGQSNFKLARWLPKYLRWYFHAFGPPKRAEEPIGRRPSPERS